MLYHNGYTYGFVGNGTVRTQIYNTSTVTGWNHYALTYANGTGTVYINGQVHASGNPSGLSIAGGLSIGRDPVDGVNIESGMLMDDIRFYNYSLTLGQIQLLYSNGAGRGIAYTQSSQRAYYQQAAATTNRRRRVLIGAA